ncbi:MAG: polysaccharide deacetylase family protein [Actinomycetota bacterium]
MRRRRHRHAGTRLRLSQLLIGLVALPLSALPFVGYTTLTPEGRLVRDRALVALWPPSLPTLSGATLASAARAVPAYDDHVMALAYHGIGSASDGEGGFVISADRFGEHLVALRAAGMHAVTATQVADAFAGGPALPPKSVMITFDDGRTDAMMFADPLLEEAGMKATMFVITGAAESPGIYYASWERLDSYAGSGRWDLQSHTASLHREQKVKGGDSLPALTSLAPGESLAEYRARVRTDLSEADGALERHTGRRPVAFAYPFGAYGAERANASGIEAVLREEVGRRYEVAFHQDDQDTVHLAGPDDDRLGLRRLEVEDWSGTELLQRIARAVRLTPGLQPPPDAAGPLPQTTPPATSPVTAPPAEDRPTAGPFTTAPRPAAPRRGAPAPASTPPAAGAPPAPATTTTTTRPPPASTTTTAPTTGATATTTTTTTRPPATTTTTTTTTPPTTTPNGCRSHGQGNVCPPGRS